MEDIEKFEEILNYKFKDRNLLVQALSHSSYANEKKKSRISNERLEFLGLIYDSHHGHCHKSEFLLYLIRRSSLN